MALIPFGLLAADGSPAVGATPSFVAFIKRDGSPLLPLPTIVQPADGSFAFEATAEHIAEGVVWVIASGAAATPDPAFSPNYQAGAIHAAREPFEVVLLRNESDGELWAGGAGSLPVWNPIVGSPHLPPDIATPRPYLQVITPTEVDIAIGIGFRFDAPAGAVPKHVFGGFAEFGDVSAPVVTLIGSPGPTTPTAPILLSVTDETALRAVQLSILFTATGAYEVVHDGEDFAPFYADLSTREVIEDGFTFSLSRRGGFPAGPFRLRVRAIDTSGNEDV